MKPRFTLGAFAIVADDAGRVLLCRRRDSAAWNLPGGVVEHGESPWGAVAREVQEETGLRTAVRRLLGVYAKPDIHEVVFSFEVGVVDGSIAPTDEAERIEYFPADDLPESLLQNQRERILDWVSSAPTVVMKEQRSSRAQ